jgi:ADP-ribose pyrophosphatase YjhB (NUDIX family)
MPVPAVAAVIYRADQLLLVKRRNPPSAGKWSIPGGVQEVGEQTHSAIKREVREETGIAVDVLDLLEAGDVIRRDANGRITYHYLILYYLAMPRGGLLCAGDDVSEVGWFTLDEARALDLADGMLEILLRAVREAAKRSE